MNTKNYKIPPIKELKTLSDIFNSFRDNSLKFFTELSHLGDVTLVSVKDKNFYFLSNPEHIKNVLLINSDKFVKGKHLQYLKNVLGEGLVTSEKELHLRQRRLLQPIFTRSEIFKQAPIIDDLTNNFIYKWENEEKIDISSEMINICLEIMSKCLLNLDVEKDIDVISKSMTSIIKNVLFTFSEVTDNTSLPQIKNLQESVNNLDAIIYRIIEEKKETETDGQDILTKLLNTTSPETGEKISCEQIRDELITFFLVGHETSATTLTWCLYLLALNPKIKSKLQEEIDSILIGETSIFENIHKLKYCQNVLAETMRMFPPIWILTRTALEDVELGEYLIKSGESLSISTYVLHRDDRFWDSPNEFIPERWNLINMREYTSKCIYIPFSYGIRNCLGENFAWTEILIILANIISKWEFELEVDQNVIPSPQLTLRPKTGIEMILHKR